MALPCKCEKPNVNNEKNIIPICKKCVRVFCGSFSNLKDSDKSGIHETLFQMDILELDEDEKVEGYYNQLPEDIKKEGMRWGFQDSVVMDNMCEWFQNNLI